jgi:chorismate synthase
MSRPVMRRFAEVDLAVAAAQDETTGHVFKVIAVRSNGSSDGQEEEAEVFRLRRPSHADLTRALPYAARSDRFWAALLSCYGPV